MNTPFVTSSSVPADQATPAPDSKRPVVRRNREQRSRHGFTWQDDYLWLIDVCQKASEDTADGRLANEEITAFIHAENEYADAVYAHLNSLERTLAVELRSRMDENEDSLPVHHDDYLYWVRFRKDAEHAQHCRLKIRSQEDAAAIDHDQLDKQQPEIFLDENACLDGDEVEIGDWAVSPDHRYVAYTIDATGEERYSLYLKHIASGYVVQPLAHEVGPAVCWGTSSKHFFYSGIDDQGRVCRVRVHTLGEPWHRDRVVYKEHDPLFEVDFERARDESHVIITSSGDDTSEVHLLNLTCPENGARCVTPRTPGVEYYVECQESRLIVLTNAPRDDDQDDADADSFYLAIAMLSAPDAANWLTLDRPSPGVHIEWVVAYKTFLFMLEVEDGLQRGRVLPTTKERIDINSSYLLIASKLYTEELNFLDDDHFDTHSIWFERSSLSQPERIEVYDAATRTHSVQREYEPYPEFNGDDYAEERLEVSSAGVSVPVSIVYNKRLRRPGGNPLVLYGYGAYECGAETDFDADRLSLLDRGVVYAIAHVRGGDEKGRAWYDDGRMLNKENSFHDYIAVAQSLIDRQITYAGGIVAHGESAGGLLVGAAVNRRPELFAGVLAEVPFVDVIETMSNVDWPTTPQDYDEFGNPEEKAVFEVMRRYCPYNNVRKQHYPPIYITADFNDQRVPWWEAARWAAKLRDHNEGDSAITLTITEQGHQGRSGRYLDIDRVSRSYAFILDCLGLAAAPAPRSEPAKSAVD